MPKSKRSSATTIVLSRYFDKNVDLVAGMCSKCYLEGKDDVKIIAVNRKFLKEVEKLKKLKLTKFLHVDYPCEDDCISRQTFENDRLKLPLATTNDDYALITGDTSRSRQIEPRINCYNNNSACGNEVRSLCTNTENSSQPAEKVDNKNCFYDNIKIETNGNFSTKNISNILHNFNDLNSITDSNSIISDNFKPRENSFDEHNNDFVDVDSILQPSCLKMEYYSSHEKLNAFNCSSAENIVTNESNSKIIKNQKITQHLVAPQNILCNHDYIKNNPSEETLHNIQNISCTEFQNVQNCADWNIQNSLRTEHDLDNCNNLDIQYPTYSQNNLDIRDCSNYHNDFQFEDTINIEKNSNSNTRNNIIAQNYEDNSNKSNKCKFQNDQEVSKTHHQNSRSRNTLMDETTIVNNLDVLDSKDNTETKNTLTTCDIQNNIKIRKIHFSNLEKFHNSQKPKWLQLNENSNNMKTEDNLQQPSFSMKDENFNCNTIDIPKTEIKCEIVKRDFDEMRRTINFAKLKIKKKTILEKPVWIPPRSPHNLIEESLFHDPWSLLIATIFLNKTSCMCARPRVEEFLRDFSGPLDVLKERPTKLEKYFLDLGLHKKRAEQVWRMSYDYAYKNWRNPKELYGIGKYGEDAYRMFILGDLDIEPTDRFLRIYRDWAKMKQKEDMNRMCPDVE